MISAVAVFVPLPAQGCPEPFVAAGEGNSRSPRKVLLHQFHRTGTVALATVAAGNIRLSALPRLLAISRHHSRPIAALNSSPDWNLDSSKLKL